MTSHPFPRVLAVVLALVLLCSPVAAQQWAGSGRVTGMVTDEEDNPVVGATVYFEMAEDREIGPPPLVTNKKGKFTFLGLRGGKWIVRVEAEGFHDWHSDGVIDVYSKGKSDDVLAVLERMPQEEILAIARFEANEFLEKGDELAGEGRFDAARAEYDKALTELEEVDHPVVLASIAATYMNEGNFDQAKTALETSLAIDPEHIESLKNYCAIVAAEGRMEEAEAILAKIPEEEQVHPTTLMNIGLAHFNKGEMEEANVFLDRAIRDNPEVSQAYYFRGLAKLNLGDNDGARADFEHFVEAMPDSPQAAEAEEYLKYLTETPSGG